MLEQHGTEINSLRFKAFICWYIAHIRTQSELNLKNWIFKILFEDGSFVLHCHIYYWSFSLSLLFKMKWSMNIGKWNEKNPMWCPIKYNQVFLFTIQYILICHFSDINNDLGFFFLFCLLDDRNWWLSIMLKSNTCSMWNPSNNVFIIYCYVYLNYPHVNVWRNPLNYKATSSIWSMYRSRFFYPRGWAWGGRGRVR